MTKQLLALTPQVVLKHMHSLGYTNIPLPPTAVVKHVQLHALLYTSGLLIQLSLLAFSGRNLLHSGLSTSFLTFLAITRATRVVLHLHVSIVSHTYPTSQLRRLSRYSLLRNKVPYVSRVRK